MEIPGLLGVFYIYGITAPKLVTQESSRPKNSTNYLSQFSTSQRVHRFYSKLSGRPNRGVGGFRMPIVALSREKEREKNLDEKTGEVSRCKTINTRPYSTPGFYSLYINMKWDSTLIDCIYTLQSWPKKVCPRLRDLATAPAVRITQPRTNFFVQLCTLHCANRK